MHLDSKMFISFTFRYAYLPNFKVDSNDRIVPCEKSAPDYKVSKHDFSQYCPHCLDDWCCNGVRPGCEYSEVEMPVIDDRLYEAILEEKGEENAKEHLVNVIKATDLVASVDSSFYSLVRKGPGPWEKDHAAPDKKAVAMDHEYPWYEPDEIEYIPENIMPPMLKPICSSLEYLLLNSDKWHAKHTLVPFMLYALPKVKSFGHLTVVDGLRMIREIPALKGISAKNLEELEYMQCTMDKFRDITWASDEICSIVDKFNRQEQITEDTPEETLRSSLRADVKLITEECPNLKKIAISLFVDKTFLHANDDDIWSPFGQGLPKLTVLALRGHRWSEVEALVRTIGARLTFLFLTLRCFDSLVTPNFPKLDDIFQLCPRLIVIKFGIATLTLDTNLSMEEIYRNPPTSRMESLTEFTILTIMTKRAFIYLWNAAPNLREINASYGLVMNDNFPHDPNDSAEFDANDVSRLFRCNPMKAMRKFYVPINMKNILTARSFIEKLAGESISKLSIRVALPQDHYPTQEQMLIDIAQEMNRMKQFKDLCHRLRKNQGKVIKWSWKRVGILESLGNLGLHNFDSDEEHEDQENETLDHIPGF